MIFYGVVNFFFFLNACFCIVLIDRNRDLIGRNTDVIDQKTLYLLAYNAQSKKVSLFVYFVSLVLFIAQWTLAKYVLPTVCSTIFLIRHLMGNKKSGNIGVPFLRIAHTMCIHNLLKNLFDFALVRLK